MNVDSTKVNKGGRPSKFDPSQLKIIEKLCKLGATDDDLAEALEVSVSTINNWKSDFPEFLESLKEHKAIANSLVEQALFKRAMGAKVNEVKVVNNVLEDTVKEYPPDLGSCIVWLSNRDPKRWKKDGQTESDDNNQPVSKIQIEVVGANINNSTDSASS